jgi:hypothetical protein
MRTAEGKLYMFATIDRTSKFAFASGARVGDPGKCVDPMAAIFQI